MRGATGHSNTILEKTTNKNILAVAGAVAMSGAAPAAGSVAPNYMQRAGPPLPATPTMSCSAMSGSAKNSRRVILA